MAIFGFIVLCLITAYITFASVTLAISSFGFTGKIDPMCWIFAILSAGLWYIVFTNAPFTITFN